MRASFIRLILAALCLFPALLLCNAVALMALGQIFQGDIYAALTGTSFIACVVLFVWFVVDTVKLIREGK